MDKHVEENKIRLLLDLVLKLNETFLEASDLEDVLSAVLVGITAGEGLGFNRAFLFKLDEDSGHIKGSAAIGPASAEEAGRIWHEISVKRLSLFDILDNVRTRMKDEGNPLLSVISGFSVPLDNADHVLVASLQGQGAMHVRRGEALIFDGGHELCDLFGVDEFAVVPLVTHRRPFGVVVADNYITRRRITESDLDALHLFAGLGSIALCQASMCSLMQDRIVDLQRLNSEVVRSRGLLIKAERYAAIGKMADQLLHELRNPVSAIGGLAGVLRKRLSRDSGLGKYAENIITQCERIERTLDELFELAHEPTLSGTEEVRLHGLVSATLDIFRHEMARLDIDLEVNFPDQEPVVHVDRAYFQQALINVIKNAIEAMPDGGLLVVSVEYDDTTVNIRVKDSGLGIARAHLNRLDEPFFTTKSHAMGLGLSLGKKVLEQHGGSLAVECNEAGGATVTLTVPRCHKA